MAYIINQSMCSCCHVCRVNCPMGAINFNENRKYQIDPAKCVSCGKCASLCNNSAITLVGAVEEIIPHEPVKKDCDVLVLGAGASGLVAAAKAASMGKKVILVEKAKKIGGSCWFAGGYRTWYCKRMAEMGYEDPRPAMYEDFKKNVQGIDYDLLKRIFDANGEMLDWIIEEGDVDFETEFSIGMNPWGQLAIRPNFKKNVEHQTIDPTIGPGAGGSNWVFKMSDLCEKFGVEIIKETRANKLVLGADGAIEKVLASDPGGDYEISCKACVIATGAMTHNKELTDRIAPDFADNENYEPIHKFTAPTCTGDGIVMCEELGADIDWENTRLVMFGPAYHPFPYPGLAITRSPFGMSVNLEGKRWGSEVGGMELRHSLREQTRHVAWRVYNAEQVRLAVEANVNGEGDANGRDMLGNWEAQLAEDVELGIAVKKADTLEELAALMGVDVEGFMAEVAHYNEMCAKGVDEDFGKPARSMLPLVDGPYYGFFQGIFHENGIGGMTIDKHARVMKNGVPIPGLYAAGDTTRGIMVPGDVGVEYIEAVITAFTTAVVTGYMCGDEAGAYVG